VFTDLLFRNLQDEGIGKYYLHITIFVLIIIGVIGFAIMWGDKLAATLETPAKEFRGIVGYDVHPNKTKAEFLDWLWNKHYPDLLANPHVGKITLESVVAKKPRLSNGQVMNATNTTFEHMAVLHFQGSAGYDRYVQFFVDNPIPADRSPTNFCQIKFYVLADAREVLRGSINSAKSYLAEGSQ